jgi:negative regulator of sigma E activity
MSHSSENLSAYLDGELAPEEVAELEAALSTDPDLREQLDALEATVTWMRTHGPLEAPEGFAEGILARVAEEDAPVAALVWLRRPLGVPLEALALAAAALLVLVLAMQPEGEPSATLADREIYEPSTPGAAAWAPAEEEEPEAPESVESVAPAPMIAPGPSRPSASARPRPAARKKDGVAPTMAAPAPKPAPLIDKSGSVGFTGGEQVQEAEAEGGTSGLGGMTRVPFTYTLSATNSGVLKQLDVLVRRLGGRLETSRGEAFPVAVMGPGTEQVFVRLPNTQIATFGAELARLGDVHLQDANEMVVSSEVTLQIQVDYEPGTTTYEPAAEER